MKKMVKILIVLCLFCSLISMTALAGDSNYARYGISNSGKNWLSTNSTNTKADAGKPWFIRVDSIQFGNASLSGTLGMAFAPCIWNNGALLAQGATYWTKNTNTGYMRLGWLGNAGGAGVTYTLGIRLDDLIIGGPGSSSGAWNAN